MCLLTALLAGCITSYAQRPVSDWLNRYNLRENRNPESLQYCQTTGCTQRIQTSLTRSQWQRIQHLFTPPARTPAEERRQIALAMGQMERLIGPIANTANDEARNVLFPDKPGFQLDCIAEASNTTQTLLLLQHQDLLQWHTPGYPTHRGPLQLQAPHYSALITDITTQKRWSVDSWFFDNGEPAVLVPESIWRSGYSPDNRPGSNSK